MEKVDNIYLDYQSSTPMDKRVIDAMEPYYSKDFGNPHSNNHIYGWKASQAIDLSLEKISNYLSCNEDEIIFTSGATEANNLAIIGACLKNTNKKKNKILISSIEHPCVIEAANFAKEFLNYKVIVIPVHKDGYINEDTLKIKIDDSILLASIMCVNNEIGVIQNLKEIQSILKPFNILFHTDASQAPLALNIEEIIDFVDMLSLSSHKVYGPKGIGCLYIKSHIQKLINPIIQGGGQQNNLRSGTLPTALCVGFAKSMEILKDEGFEERKRIEELRNSFFESLKIEIPNIKLNGPQINERHPMNLNVCIKGIDADDLIASLQPKVSLSSGSACSTGEIKTSHVLEAIGLEDEEARSSFRIGLGRNTHEQEIDVAVKLISNALSLDKTYQSSF